MLQQVVFHCDVWRPAALSGLCFSLVVGGFVGLMSALLFSVRCLFAAFRIRRFLSSHVCLALRIVRACVAFLLRVSVAVLLELTELAKPVERPCLCCNTRGCVVWQHFKVWHSATTRTSISAMSHSTRNNNDISQHLKCYISAEVLLVSCAAPTVIHLQGLTKRAADGSRVLSDMYGACLIYGRRGGCRAHDVLWSQVSQIMLGAVHGGSVHLSRGTQLPNVSHASVVMTHRYY